MTDQVSPKTPSIARSTAIMTVGTTLSRLTGYVRFAALGWALGVGRFADNYMLANLMPNMIFEMIAGGILTSILIPVYMEYMINKSREEADKVASTVANFTILALVILSVIGITMPYLFAKTQTFLIKEGHSDIDAVAFYFRFFIPQIIFYGIVALTTAMLNAHKRFAAPAFAPIANNVIVTLTVIFAYAPLRNSDPDLAMIMLASGTTMGVIAMAVAQLPAYFRLKSKYYFSLNLRHPAVKKIGLLSIPIFGYVLLNQIGLTVANNLAYQFEGGVAALQYAWPLFLLAYGIFSVSITNALFPNLSESWSTNDLDSFKRYLGLGIKTTGFLLIPAAAGLIALAEPIIKLLYVIGGEFSLTGAQYITPVLRAYALGIFFYGTWVFLTRVFYSLQDTRTPLMVNAMGVPFNIIVDIILVRYLQVTGLALGLALTYMFTSSVILLLLKRKIGAIGLRHIAVSLGRQVVAASLMALLVFLVSGNLQAYWSWNTKIQQLLLVLISLTAGAVSYYLLSKGFKVEELRFFNDLFNKKTKLDPTLINND